MKRISYLFLSFALFFCADSLFSQTNSGGEPISTLVDIGSSFETKSMPYVDRDRLLDEDRINLSQPTMPFRYGTVFNINYNLNNSGTWEALSDGSRIWRLRIYSANAISINLFFNDFYIPEGGQFFVYNQDKSMVLGAFTHLNNAENNNFATAPTLGEGTVLEYYEPVYAKGKGKVNVSQVVHAYRDIFGYLTTDELACNININCPIGAPWVDQKRAVTRITFTQGSGSFLCTGSLVNNTLQDRKLYYLTAEHCAPDNHSSMVFYFNYESPTCVGTSGNLSQTISGATLKAANYDTDFRLVELNGTLPASYNAYFNGWDKSNAQPTREIAIHHPGGANKKISIDSNAAVTSNGFGGRLPGGFWLVIWDEGMTEGGSSGCPLYDQNKRVIGQNLGGTPSNCENPQGVLKYFGKFSSSWNHGGSSTNQLKDWLDPNNSNVSTLDGINAVTGIAPQSNFTSNIQALPITGGSVNFFDLTTNGPTTWSWSFPGGTPSSSNIQNPTGIQYSATGAYTVSLTTTNAFGSNVKTLINYITVAGVPMSSYSVISPTTLSTITVANNDPTLVHFNWNRPNPSSTVLYTFRIRKFGTTTDLFFTSNNNGLDSIISLRKSFLDSIGTQFGYTGDSVRCIWRAAATNGVDTLLSSNANIITFKSTTIGITPIGNIVPQIFNLFNNYPNPFNPKTNITFDVPKQQFIKIRVYDLQGREVAVLVNQNLVAGRYNVDFDGANLASGVYFYSLEAHDFYKVNKMVLVK
jgi:PKD repeat protein